MTDFKQVNITGDANTSGFLLNVSRAGSDNYIRVQSGSPNTTYSGIAVTEQGGSFGWFIRQNSNGGDLTMSHNNNRDNLDNIADRVTITASGDVSARSFNQISDAKEKKNIQPIENVLQKIQNLRGITFEWKENNFSCQSNKQLGLIAQEVETIFPEIVEMSDKGMKSINYAGLIAPMIEAIKMQQEQISDLLKQLKKQESKISELNLSH